MQANYDHPLYIHCEESKANAFAFAFVNSEKFEKFPYILPDLAEDEIRANVLYAGLCLSDSLHGRSKWGPAMYPLAPGHEIIGVVEEVGSKVSNFKKGDKVAFGTLRDCCDNCKYCKNNKEPLCEDKNLDLFTYGLHWGGYSTHLQQPARFFFKLPENMDLRRAAPLLCAGITVYNPIKLYLKPGFKTAVIGIGGLGHLAVQFLAKMGHEVFGVTNSMEKEKFIRSLGATSVFTIDNKEDYKKNKGQFDLIINTTPQSNNFQKYLDLTARGGYFIQVGAPDVSESVSLNLLSVVFNELNIVGSLVGSRADIVEMLDFCAEKDIYPIIEEFSFEEFPKALDKLENGKPIFRCVVNCGEFSKIHGLQK